MRRIQVSAGYYEFYYICLRWYFRTNEHIAKAAKKLVTYWIINYYMSLSLFLNVLTSIKKIWWWAHLHSALNRHNWLDVRLLYWYLQVRLDAHWFRNHLWRCLFYPLWSSRHRQSRRWRHGSSEEIVSRNYAAQISIDKRMSCTASDDALSISFPKKTFYAAQSTH